LPRLGALLGFGGKRDLGKWIKDNWMKEQRKDLLNLLSGIVTNMPIP
jgi:hypothetical protein